VFPLFWQHPAIKGITLWGYRPGMWRTGQGANLALDNGAERPALVWLREYVKGDAAGQPAKSSKAHTAAGVGH
jgi:endo-1,4-beta-xylanase